MGLGRRTTVGLVALAATAAASGIAFAAIPDSKGAIHACYATNGTGALNVYDPANTDGSVPTSCLKGQTSFAFNQTGPVGPAGPPGPPSHLPAAAADGIEQDLALIQNSLHHLEGAIAAVPGLQRVERKAFLMLRRRFESATTVSARMTDLGEMSDQTSLGLQKAMDSQSKFLTTLSNLEKKLADTESTLEQNLK